MSFNITFLNYKTKSDKCYGFSFEMVNIAELIVIGIAFERKIERF